MNKLICQFVTAMKKKETRRKPQLGLPQGIPRKEQQQGLFIVPIAKVKIKVNLHTVSNKEGRTSFDFPSLVMKLGDLST